MTDRSESQLEDRRTLRERIGPFGWAGSINVFARGWGYQVRWFVLLPPALRPWSLYRPKLYRRSGALMAFGCTLNWGRER